MVEQGSRQAQVGNILISIVAAGIWAISIFVLTGQLLAGWRGFLAWNPWALSDWLISYAGGFQRRGLSGTLIHWIVSDRPALPVISVFLLILLGVFVVLFIGLISRCRPFGRSLLIISLAPGSIVAMASANFFYDRKEMLFHVSLACVSLLVALSFKTANETMRRRLLIAAATVASTSFAILPLVHEAFLFLSAPAHAAVLLTAAVALDRPWLKKLTFGLLAVAVLQFVVAGVWHGSPQAAQTIWDSLSLQDRRAISPFGPLTAPMDAIGVTAWPIRNSIGLPLEVLASGTAWYWLVPLALSFGNILLLSSPLFGGRPDTFANASAIWIALFVCSLPAYLLGWDWGRWISILTIETSIVLCVCHITGECALWQPLRPASMMDVTWPATKWFFVLVIVIDATFQLPDCCLKSTSRGGLLSLAVPQIWP